MYAQCCERAQLRALSTNLRAQAQSSRYQRYPRTQVGCLQPPWPGSTGSRIVVKRADNISDNVTDSSSALAGPSSILARLTNRKPDRDSQLHVIRSFDLSSLDRAANHARFEAHLQMYRTHLPRKCQPARSLSGKQNNRRSSFLSTLLHTRAGAVYSTAWPPETCSLRHPRSARSHLPLCPTIYFLYKL